MDIFKINGSLIQELRDEMGWTREDLCEKSGVPIGTIQDIHSCILKLDRNSTRAQKIVRC